jgi:hydrogenase nickel incorporation protein HypA/HybF
MHELSIAQGILDIIGQYVPEGRAPEVRAVRVRVGQMAGVIADSLDFCFSAIVNGTALNQARLDIEEIPLRSRCSSCGKEFAPDPVCFSCPVCGSADIAVTSGTELQVVDIEMADPATGVL